MPFAIQKRCLRELSQSVWCDIYIYMYIYIYTWKPNGAPCFLLEVSALFWRVEAYKKK